LKPAGVDNATGIIVATFYKDPTDARWDNDDGIRAYRVFFAKYSGMNIADTSLLTGYQQGMMLEQILKQCGEDLSRENIQRQAKNLNNFRLATAMPGIVINTSETNNMIWTQLQLQRWTGKNWEQIEGVLDARGE